MLNEDGIHASEGSMIQQRQTVMTLCACQVCLALALASAGAMRRTPTLAVMQPFFVAAGAFGYFGARDCKPWMISSHFVGSSGLSLVIGLYIIAESFLKESGKADLLFFALNGPMDLFMVAGSFASLSLWRALVRLRRQLRLRRAAMYEQLEESATRLGEPGAGASLSRALRGDLLAGAAERRQVGGSLGDGASDSLLRDLRCPISMEARRGAHAPASTSRWRLETLTLTLAPGPDPLAPRNKGDARPGHRPGRALVRAGCDRAMVPRPLPPFGSPPLASLTAPLLPRPQASRPQDVTDDGRRLDVPPARAKPSAAQRDCQSRRGAAPARLEKAAPRSAAEAGVLATRLIPDV